MDKREKLIQAITICNSDEVYTCKKCPYYDEYECQKAINKDMIEVLKIQQAEIALNYNNGYMTGYQNAIRDSEYIEKIKECIK